MADEHPHSHPPLGDQGDRPVASEEPLDPANQSLADALRASFWVLKRIMILVVVLFLASGLFIVDEQKEAVVLLRFGKLHQVFTRDLHWSWPYPIDQKIRIPTAQKTMTIDAFWLRISDADKGKDPSELRARGSGLDPVIEGALLTGDEAMAIIHLLLKVTYVIDRPELFVRNVKANAEGDEVNLLRPVLQSAAVAIAARTSADVLWKNAGAVVGDIRARAQEALDRMETGIRLQNVDAPQSYYPLQVKDAVLNVSQAENRQNETIQKARTERQKTLHGAAGAAWQELWTEIQKLDQQLTADERQQVLKTIRATLMGTTKTTGKAGEMIQEANKERERIVLGAQRRAKEFTLLLGQYESNTELFRQRFLMDMLQELYSGAGIKKWFLPAGSKQIVLWLNPDPKEIKEAQEALARKKVGQ